jgi:hypothetical protein
MNQNNRRIYNHSGIDYKVCKLVLFQLKNLIEQPDNNTQRQRQHTLDEKAYDGIFHHRRHNRICLTEPAGIDESLGAKPIGYVKKIQKKQLCAKSVLPGPVVIT